MWAEKWRILTRYKYHILDQPASEELETNLFIGLIFPKSSEITVVEQEYRWPMGKLQGLQECAEIAQGALR